MKFQSFFMGRELGPIERLCLASFIAHGHTFVLHAYTPMSVPRGVTLADAATVIPLEARDEFFRIAPDRVSQFSNGFRFHLLHHHGGWWVDTDVLCLSSNVPDDDVVLGWEIEDFIGSAIMKFPAGHPLTAQAIEFWKAHRDVAQWGYTGPALVTRLAREHGLDRVAHPIRTIYPTDSAEAEIVLDPGRRAELAMKIDGKPFLHLWMSMLFFKGRSRDEPPPPNTFLFDMMEQYLGGRMDESAKAPSGSMN